MIEAVLAICLWFGLGGWAFYHLNDGNNVGGTLLACTLLAPFAAGAALAKSRAEKLRKPQ